MITFKQFLYENKNPVRTSPISVEELIAWCDKNARAYLKGDRFLFRGGSGLVSQDLLIGDSNAGEPRKSKNARNNYTLWIDNHSAWEGWPKRSRSFIATTSSQTAAGFGNASWIIPEDSADIGMVGDDDIWYVIVHGDINLEEFNIFSGDTYSMLGHYDPNNFRELKDTFEEVTVDEIEVELKEPTTELKSAVRNSAEKILAAMKQEKVDNLYELWEKCVAPTLFRKTTGASVSRDRPIGEVWIQGKCVFIPTKAARISLDDRLTLLEWANEKYPKFGDQLGRVWVDEDEE